MAKPRLQRREHVLREAVVGLCILILPQGNEESGPAVTTRDRYSAGGGAFEKARVSMKKEAGAAGAASWLCVDCWLAPQHPSCGHGEKARSTMETWPGYCPVTEARTDPAYPPMYCYLSPKATFAVTYSEWQF